MKNIILLFAGCLALLMSSCLGSDDYDYEISNDCEILTFYLSNDSIDGLSDVVFTIDQVSGRIFNIDSMPYGTVIDEKVICNITLASTVYQCQAIEQATGDTIVWTSTEDSIDFSKPVTFINTLWDGITTKVYQAQINIHQVVPDSMVWSLYKSDVLGYQIKDEKVVTATKDGKEYFYMYVDPASASSYELYTSASSDGENWTKQTLSGLPYGKINLSQITIFQDVFYAVSNDGGLYSSDDGLSWKLISSSPFVKSILGALNVDDDYTVSGRQSSALAAVLDVDGVPTFAAMSTDGTWKQGEAVYSGFPINGFASWSYNQMYRDRLLVACGKDKDNKLVNTTWTTDDGYRWTSLSNDGFDRFDAMEGVSVANYDGGFFMVGGLKADGTASKDIYTSQDGGISWTLSDTLVLMPEDFKARGYMSMLVNEAKYMYLFGGKKTSGGNVQDQIWRGRINRLGFPNE
jgi:hypothetical protein